MENTMIDIVDNKIVTDEFIEPIRLNDIELEVDMKKLFEHVKKRKENKL